MAAEHPAGIILGGIAHDDERHEQERGAPASKDVQHDEHAQRGADVDRRDQIRRRVMDCPPAPAPSTPTQRERDEQQDRRLEPSLQRDRTRT